MGTAKDFERVFDVAKFRMVCPKCGSRHFHLGRDRAFGTKDTVIALVFSCSCGKQLFGQAVLDEFDSQAAASKGEAAKRAAAKRAKKEPPPRPEDIVRCAFRDCDLPARRRSKYCSRTCSNRNARDRNRSRNKGET